MSQVFASWSGGKDCCLALHRALASGLDVRYLLNTITEDGKRSCSHGVSAEIIKIQAASLGIPIVQRRTTSGTYEAEFIKTLKGLKREGIKGGVFGDIDFNAHREWIERVCREAGITPYLPLWEESQKNLFREFMDAGFEAIVVAAKADFFDDEVLGRMLDGAFLAYLEELGKTKDLTICGEAGEYHTLVVNGPLFQRQVEVCQTKKTLRDGIYFLEILSVNLKDR